MGKICKENIRTEVVEDWNKVLSHNDILQILNQHFSGFTRVTMRSNATLIERVGEERWEAGPIITGEGMLINTYKAVIEFIKWYNETK